MPDLWESAHPRRPNCLRSMLGKRSGPERERQSLMTPMVWLVLGLALGWLLCRAGLG